MDFINKTDKKRANYYNYYSSKRWGDARSYDLSVDSSALGIDKTVDLIIEYIKIRYPGVIS
jgi:cytidylate kinase